MESRLNGFKMTLQLVQEDMVILKRIVLRGTPMNAEVGPKFQVPEPKCFSGNRDAKELENFLWDME